MHYFTCEVGKKDGQKEKKATHIPYRDSKLTRILQDSLGGNSVTCMLTAMSPAESNKEETVSALRFAERAKRIENKVKKNVNAKELALANSQKLSKVHQVSMVLILLQYCLINLNNGSIHYFLLL